MPDLLQSLQGRDLGHLQIIAELWGLHLDAPNAKAGLEQLASYLLDPQLVNKFVANLPLSAREALIDLSQNEGRLPWALFTRRYGALREVGPARRDRVRPYLDDPSLTETLWYRALLARAFFATPQGVEEFVYIPSDLLALVQLEPISWSPLPGRLATHAERALNLLAQDYILDDACTLLAALRMSLPLDQFQDEWFVSNLTYLPGKYKYVLSMDAMRSFLRAANLIDDQDIPNPEETREFLEAPRPEGLVTLVNAWMSSSEFNELSLLPGIKLEGEWQNDPQETRQAVLGFLAAVPADSWWSLSSFIQFVYERWPDFQRPAGDYDSWYIRNEATGVYLRGFEHWNEVDGELLRFMISGPLHWLGIVDLAFPDLQSTTFDRTTPQDNATQYHDSLPSGMQGSERFYPTAFRFSKWAFHLLRHTAPDHFSGENGKIVARSNAHLTLPRLTSRSLRYQIARFCAWEGVKEEEYQYRITPASLKKAGQQGLRPGQLLGLLHRYAKTVPPSLSRALNRWEEQGVQARLEQALVLRVSQPEILQALRATKAARFLGDPLGPTAVIVKPGAYPKIMLALAEIGYLVEEDLF